MKSALLFLSIIGIIACNQASNETKILQSRVDSLEKKLADNYKPGFGEFMTSIQAHHSKLWFAGKDENWKLADFEIHEIMESIEDIKKYQAERKETRTIGMIDPALNSVSDAIQKKDLVLFRSSFTSLTNTCNNCHRSNDFEFNIVKIPETQPFSNQEFQPGNESPSFK
jgi:hypothetical protein